MNGKLSKNRHKISRRKMTLLLNIVFLVFSFVCFPRVGYKWNCRWNDKLGIFFFLNIQTDYRNDKISKQNIFRIRKRAFH